MGANPLNSEGWRQIEAALPPRWREAAADHGLCLSRIGADGRDRSKLSDPALLLRLVLHHVAGETSLRQTTAQAHAADLVTVSPVALHKRMRTIAPWLAQLAAELTGSAKTFAPERWAGFRLYATDGTSVTRPGAEGTSARVHYRLELATLRPQQVLMTGVSGGEMLRRFDLAPDDLDLLDRGYCNPHDVAYARRAGAHVIVRYTRGTLPLIDPHGQPLDIVSKVSRLRVPGHVQSWHARVAAPEGHWIEGRICAVRLSEQAAQRAQRRLRDERGSKVTASDLAWAHFLVVFTTVPTERLSALDVLELFRLRWQVELQIKRDKSLGDLDTQPNFRDDTIASWICGKLLAQALARAFIASAPLPPLASGATPTRAA